MIYFEKRDSKVWTSSSTKDVGPGSYNIGKESLHWTNNLKILIKTSYNA